MNLKRAFAVALLVAAAIATAQQKLDGRYYWFQDDKKPSGNQFKAADGPLGCLVLLSNRQWSMSFIMRESFSWKGSYTIIGDRITLREIDGTGAFWVLQRKGNDLKSISGEFSEGMDMLYRMTAQWEKSFSAQADRAAVFSQASQLAKAFWLYAADSDEIMPKTQKELEADALDYVVNKRLYNGFVYTFKGGKLPPESKRANLIIGYVKSPYGIAQILANGDARWKK